MIIDIKGEKKDRKDLKKEIENLQKKLVKSPKLERAVETMLKLTSQNHVTLSGMADNKSNIMISINTIILSVIVSMLFTKIEEHPMILVPTLMLVVTCLAAIIFAILATRPSIARGTFTTEDIQQRKTNLLFFFLGFSTMKCGMRNVLGDKSFASVDVNFLAYPCLIYSSILSQYSAENVESLSIFLSMYFNLAME